MKTLLSFFKPSILCQTKKQYKYTTLNTIKSLEAESNNTILFQILKKSFLFKINIDMH